MQQMYVQEDCYIQRNYLKLTNMDERFDMISCMITIKCGSHKQLKHLMKLTQKSEKQKHL